MKTTFLPLIVFAAQSVFAANDATEGYAAHEWGTFTSVQGADGVLVRWNPLETTKLPKFVYDWSKPGLHRLPAGVLNPGSKSAFATLQRMETPVIYFYADQERTVDVTVRFPQGLITEWYPQAVEIGPSAFPPNTVAIALDRVAQRAGLNPQPGFASRFGKKGVSDSRIHWRHLHLLPRNAHADLNVSLPGDSSGNHYFAARETDSTFVRVDSPEEGRPAEHEKFLFYRGVASFQTPLNVTLGGANEESFTLRNCGEADLRHMFVLRVRKGRGGFAHVDRLAPGEFRSINCPLDGQPAQRPLGEVLEELSREMEGALAQEGLYGREAAAMVKTWRESWFEEEGVRVIYILPRKWTDEILPLALDPKPRELVRVMVGRAEIITPTMKWELLKQIVRFAEGDSAGRQQAVAGLKTLGLGRFTQPALQAVLGGHPSQGFSRAASELVDAAAAKPGDEKSLAAK
jgi:hypothetical protein